MFSSSADLRAGLHRTLAVIAAAAPRGPVDAVWWSTLPEGLRDSARRRALTLEELGPLFVAAEAHERLFAGFARLSAGEPPPAEVLGRMFADAVLSGRALKAHGGRDVYGASNKRIWDALVEPVARAVHRCYGPDVADWASMDVRAREPDAAVVALLERLIAFDTQPGGAGHETCADFVAGLLRARGFSVELVRAAGHAPVIVATRAPRGLRGEIVFYGHYDVSPYQPERSWRYPPQVLTVAEGRLWGRGVADDLGPLVTRLWALESLEETPALRWFIQGEEERGSPLAHRVFPKLLAGLRPTLWLEETGYHDQEDGTLRLLARTIGARPGESSPPDQALDDLLLGLRLLMGRYDLGTREEHRSLNKDAFASGCPYGRNLPGDGRYIALGVNDSRARIHTTDESIPAWTVALHREELRLVFRWADRAAS